MQGAEGREYEWAEEKLHSILVLEYEWVEEKLHSILVFLGLG